MLKWIKRHKRKIFASLACLTLLILFALPCFAYEVEVEDVGWFYNYTDGYITFSSSAYDYINDVASPYNPPWLAIGLSDDAIGSYGVKSGQYQSSFNSLNVQPTLNAYYASAYTWFRVNATLDPNSELGVRLSTLYEPFYLLWNNEMLNGGTGSTPFKLQVECDTNTDLIVNTDIILEVSPFGGYETKRITFEDVGSWSVSYSDILDNIPAEWDIIVDAGSYSNTYGLYVHSIKFVTDVYSDVDDLSFSNYAVYHRFQYGTKYGGETLYHGDERYEDLSEFDIPTPPPPTVEVINGYVYVDGVNTGIESFSADNVDWLQFTLEWLSNAVDGFLKIEFVPYVTLGTLLIIIVSFSVVMWWLKVFGGG